MGKRGKVARLSPPCCDGRANSGGVSGNASSDAGASWVVILECDRLFVLECLLNIGSDC